MSSTPNCSQHFAKIGATAPDKQSLLSPREKKMPRKIFCLEVAHNTAEIYCTLNIAKIANAVSSQWLSWIQVSLCLCLVFSSSPSSSRPPLVIIRNRKSIRVQVTGRGYGFRMGLGPRQRKCLFKGNSANHFAVYRLSSEHHYDDHHQLECRGICLAPLQWPAGQRGGWSNVHMTWFYISSLLLLFLADWVKELDDDAW